MFALEKGITLIDLLTQCAPYSKTLSTCGSWQWDRTTDRHAVHDLQFRSRRRLFEECKAVRTHSPETRNPARHGLLLAMLATNVKDDTAT